MIATAEQITRDLADATEQELVTTAKAAISDCNWTVGECAARWCVKYSRGRTDADFGQMVGVPQQRVSECRRVYDTFGDAYRTSGKVWSLCLLALRADDPHDAAQMAIDNEWSVKEFDHWLRLQNGEDLTAEPESEADESGGWPPYQLGKFEGEVVESSHETLHETSDSIENHEELGATAGLSGSADHDPRETAVAPFRATGGSPPRDQAHQAPEKSPKKQDAEARARQQLTNATKLARSVAPEFALLMADHLDRLAECLRQGEREKKIVGLDKPTIDSLITSAMNGKD